MFVARITSTSHGAGRKVLHLVILIPPLMVMLGSGMAWNLVVVLLAMMMSEVGGIKVQSTVAE